MGLHTFKDSFPILRGFGEDFYALLSFTGQQYKKRLCSY